MPLTDAPKQVDIKDIYPENTPFVILNAWVEGVVPTQYGNRTMAKCIAAPVGAPPGTEQEFALWGSLCEQVQASDASEFPQAVVIYKDGKRYLFGPAPAGTPVPAGAAAAEKSVEEVIPLPNVDSAAGQATLADAAQQAANPVPPAQDVSSGGPNYTDPAASPATAPINAGQAQA